MSPSAKSARPLAVVIGLLLLALTPLAFAADVNLWVDAGIYDVRPPTSAPSRAGVSLAYDGNAIVVQLVAAGTGTLPDANLGFAGETPRIQPFDQVNLSAALGRSTKVGTQAGGVTLEHRHVSVRALQRAYEQALAEFGFTLGGDSTQTRWHFSNGTSSIRVNVIPNGRNVEAYVGR